MIFGDAFRSARSAEPAGWLADERTDDGGTVGWLIPERYESVVRVSANEPCEHWWQGYRELHGVVAEVATRHTSTPERGWFAIWEGHGFTSWSSHVAWLDPPADEATRLEREAERERVRTESQRERDRIATALVPVPTFDAPDRRYYLVTGSVGAVLDLRDPAGNTSSDGWRHPDLWWPDDRRWFVATDVEFWSLYVAGDAEFVAEIRATVPTPTEAVTRGDRLVLED